MAKKLARGAFAVALGAVLLAGCGDTESTDSNAPAQDLVQPTGSPEELDSPFNTTPQAAPTFSMGDDVPPDSPMATDEPEEQQQSR